MRPEQWAAASRLVGAWSFAGPAPAIHRAAVDDVRRFAPSLARELDWCSDPGGRSAEAAIRIVASSWRGSLSPYGRDVVRQRMPMVGAALDELVGWVPPVSTRTAPGR